MEFSAEEKAEIKKLKREINPIIDETLAEPDKHLPMVFNHMVVLVSDKQR
jgi:hypothetical protein